MSRPVDRILGRAAPQDDSFSVRPFGTTAAEAQAGVAAAATAGGTSTAPNLTTGWTLTNTKRAGFGEDAVS